MVDNVSVSGPIEIKDNSLERVAFDLMSRIAHNESGHATDPNKEVRSAQKNRKYWLNLYSECLHVVNGNLHPSKD